ncbi:PTS system arbutin-, cellobiose-, and salicin-specific EIIBC component, partial [Escherichia coli 8.0566]
AARWPVWRGLPATQWQRRGYLPACSSSIRRIQ